MNRKFYIMGRRKILHSSVSFMDGSAEEKRGRLISTEKNMLVES